MDWFVVFKYLHILAMFFFVAMAISGEIVTRRVATSGDVLAIRTTVSRVKLLVGPVASALMVAGIGFGVIAALTGQINLLAPWLVLAYVAFLGAMAIGFLITDPWLGRLETAAEASPVDAASEELTTVIGDPIARIGTWALMALIATIIFIMVVKPLG
jgi:hypothetical protein